MSDESNLTVMPRNIRRVDLIMAAVLMVILGVLFMPVPPSMLDILLTISIAFGILIMIFSMDLKEPLEFSSFPTVLLLITLFRLALNVATTRQILLRGYAGRLIEAFGQFVVGGNYLVGVVVFLILVLINFMVITKGSGRIAEVSARFTLDAMPGKQMSIDADLNQGLIDEQEARKHREKLRQEADFYGAMDGASKFISGDAMAGLIITAINIIAGFTIGMVQRGMTAGEAIQRYTILTIGDGLVSQIPALIISTSAGILVTRAAAEDVLGMELAKQLFIKPRQMTLVGGLLLAIGMVPGLPAFPFVILGASVGGFGLSLYRRDALAEKESGGQTRRVKGKGQPKQLEAGADSFAPAAPPPTIQGFKNILAVSPMDLEIGFGLIPLVDRNQGGKLIERISNVRAQIAEELGIVLPPVNVRDNVNLRNTEYVMKIRGLEVARGFVRPGNMLAIDPSGQIKMEGGIQVKEPAFGFDAYWISEGKRESAESKGLTVVDCSSVITTHLAAMVKDHAADLLSRQDVFNMVEQLRENQSAVVQELIPNKMTIGGVHRVLQGLLREKVTIRDLPVILETLADHAGRTQETLLLVELCRRSLGGHIVRSYTMPNGSLKAIGVHPRLEEMIRQSGHKEGSAFGQLAIDPLVARDVLDTVQQVVSNAKQQGMEPVVVCSPAIRPQIRQLLQQNFRDLGVLSYAEIPEYMQVDMISLIEPPAQQPAAANA